MYILFDIGGTKMRIALSRDEEVFDAPIILDTPKSYKDGIELLAKTASGLEWGEDIKAAVGGIAGPLSKDKKSLLGGPNLADWIGKPIADDLSRLLGAPVYLENDTALVGLGEVNAGAGKGKNIVAYITVSTGVGGARIIEGAIDDASVGFEPGHQIIDADKTLCPECEGNDLESLISGTSIEKRFGKKPYEIKDEKLWEETLPEILAYGLNNIIVHWSPDVIVLGGSMIVGDPAISVSSTEKYLKNIVKIFPDLPEIKKAELGALGGLHGALSYARQIV